MSVQELAKPKFTKPERKTSETIVETTKSTVDGERKVEQEERCPMCGRVECARISKLLRESLGF